MSTIFEQATRLKLRFNSDRGLLSVEDLWTFNLAKLKQLGNEVAKSLKDTEFDIFSTKTVQNTEDSLRLEVIKYIVEVREAEVLKAKQIQETQAKKARILEIMNQKQDQSLQNATMEELTAMLANL